MAGANLSVAYNDMIMAAIIAQDNFDHSLRPETTAGEW